MKEQDLRDKFIAEGCLFANADQCVQIAKEYAEQEAIEFSDWISEKGYININDFWYDQYENYIGITSELYQLFKNRENER